MQLDGLWERLPRGNQQDGCGHRFDKRRARKYKSTGVRQREVAALNVSRA